MIKRLKTFSGYHSEWNLGSPGGWDYQRITQIISKSVWAEIERACPSGVEIDFDHPALYPVYGFVEMLLEAHRSREGSNSGIIAVLAEEETLEDVAENRNLATHLNRIEGISGVLAAPHELELSEGRVCWRGNPVSTIFMDFNTDVLIALHRKHGLEAVLQAVREGRVINPRGTEPINVKSMYEIITGSRSSLFHEEIVERTPWTRRFYPRSTEGPDGKEIRDLVEWTASNWEQLVLKPERGYSGHGVRVGGINSGAEEAVSLALQEGDYIVQEKIPLDIWSENIPVMENEEITFRKFQTDFRCMTGPRGLFGFLGRIGGVPTNVGSGGGMQPLGVLRSDLPMLEAVARINEAVVSAGVEAVRKAIEIQHKMALEFEFTYLLGTIPIALRPRLLTQLQIDALDDYCSQLWSDCLTLEKMWLSGEIDEYVNIEEEELAICRMNPWLGSPAIIASDGLFGFGAEKPGWK